MNPLSIGRFIFHVFIYRSLWIGKKIEVFLLLYLIWIICLQLNNIGKASMDKAKKRGRYWNPYNLYLVGHEPNAILRLILWRFVLIHKPSDCKHNIIINLSDLLFLLTENPLSKHNFYLISYCNRWFECKYSCKHKIKVIISFLLYF